MARTGTPIEAVTFDYWNTIVRQDTGATGAQRVAAWMELVPWIPIDEVEQVFHAVWEEHHAAWLRNEQYTVDRAGRRAVELVASYLDEGPADLADALCDAFVTAGSRAELHLTPGVDDVVVALSEAGVRLGIICDVGFLPSSELRARLEGWGLLDRFDHWSFSDEVGCYKPAREIFEHALAGLGGVPAERAAHIGDLRRTDVAGALAMGMTAVRYRGVHDDATGGPEGHVVLDDYGDLLAALGLS